MQIFLQDDRAYQHWVTHHRQGFVLDGRRRDGWREMVLHRARCPQIRTRADRRTHWTTAGKFKACAHSWQELQAWAVEERGEEAAICRDCHPLMDEREHTPDPAHLTRLSAEVLDYVLESATIHLEYEYPPYRLCVADIAACFAKTPGQIAATLQHLAADGWLELGGATSEKRKPEQLVFPTAAALRTLSEYRKSTDEELAIELAKLHAK